METEVIHHIKLEEIDESPRNPRKTFDQTKLEELAESIAKHGVIQPIVVRKKEEADRLKDYEIIAGARRFRASKLAQNMTIPAIIVSMTDDEALEVQVIENLQRDDLHPLEEADGYKALMDSNKYSIQQIADKVHKQLTYVANRLQLLNLSEFARQAFYDNKMSLSMAMIVARVSDDKKQKTIVENIERGYYRTAADLQQKIITEIFIPLSGAPFTLSDAELSPEAGACTSCEYNTGNRSELFENEKGAGKCTKPKCYSEKLSEFWRRVTEAEEAKGNVVLSRTESHKLFRSWDPKQLEYSSAYVFCSSACDEHPKKSTYAKLLKGTEAKVYVVLDRKDATRRLYKISEIRPILLDQDWAKKAAKSGSTPIGKAMTNEKSQKDRERESRRDEILLSLAGPKMFEKVQKVKLDTDAWLDLYLDSFDANLENCIRGLGLEYDEKTDDEKVIRDYYKTLKKDSDKVAFMYFLYRMGEGWEWGKFAKELKINITPLKAKAKQMEAAEWKAKQDAKKAKPAKEAE